MIKYNQGSYYLCVDKGVLDTLYKAAGRPGIPVVREKIAWVPFKFKYETSTS
jgi:hypothetical protein